MDMRTDIFAEYTFGKLALQKIEPINPNFRLFKPGWLGKGDKCEVMQVTGATFRESLRGPSKGQLSIMVSDTTRSVYVTAAEMVVFDAANASH